MHASQRVITQLRPRSYLRLEDFDSRLQSHTTYCNYVLLSQTLYCRCWYYTLQGTEITGTVIVTSTYSTSYLWLLYTQTDIEVSWLLLQLLSLPFLLDPYLVTKPCYSEPLGQRWLVVRHCHCSYSSFSLVVIIYYILDHIVLQYWFWWLIHALPLIR